MNELESNFELISAFSLEITDRYKIICNLIPKENEELLRHLAASSIHLAYFVMQVSSKITNQELMEVDQKFLAECGCHFEKIIPK